MTVAPPRRPRRRLVATVAAAALAACAGAVGAARPLPATAAGPVLALSPEAGDPGQRFTASYSLGHDCPADASIGIEWDPGGPYLAYVRPADRRSCSVAVSVTPPAGRDAAGPHTVLGGTFDDSGHFVEGSQAAATYTIASAAQQATPVPVSVSPPPPPSPPPTPPPTPVPTAAPLDSLPASFPPHQCRNGVPDGPTACPSPEVALAGPTPAPTYDTRPVSTGESPLSSPILPAGVVLVVAAAAAATIAGWRSGGRRARG